MYKAPGADGIPNEMYYLLRKSEDLHYLLERTFESSLALKVMPETMRTTYYKLLYKKGKFTIEQVESGELHGCPNDPRLLANWRPIALICCDAKLFSAYVADGIKPFLDEVISRMQSFLMKKGNPSTRIL